MAVKIPPSLIIALFMVIIMVLVFSGFIFQLLFGGPEVKFVKDLAEQMESMCAEENDQVIYYNGYLPDSKGAPPDAYYFYVAVDSYNLILVGKRYGLVHNDLGAQFSDWISCVCAQSANLLTSVPWNVAKFVCSCKEGVRIIKTVPLKECRRKRIPICFTDPIGGFERCDKFEFESYEGKENLQFILNFTKTKNKLILNFTRQTICGDGLCCEGENENNCRIDCVQLDPERTCKRFE
ncbi:MAG: hypothetical protein QW625_01660 [Candidatus Nanoarchaeia archaeon]